jgi:hypothetical protein
VKTLRLLTISIIALGFLFHAPLQWGSVFVHAQDDMEMDMGMDHEAAQECLEHCMSQASQMADHPEFSVPAVAALLDAIAEVHEEVQLSNFELPDDQAPPGDQVRLLTIQKRE